MTNEQLRQLIRQRHNEIIQAFNDVYTEGYIPRAFTDFQMKQSIISGTKVKKEYISLGNISKMNKKQLIKYANVQKNFLQLPIVNREQRQNKGKESYKTFVERYGEVDKKTYYRIFDIFNEDIVTKLIEKRTLSSAFIVDLVKSSNTGKVETAFKKLTRKGNEKINKMSDNEIEKFLRTQIESV